MTDEIKFYRVRGEEYGFMSNFSPHSFHLDGKFWKTSEHYFQAKKFIGTFHEELIRNESSPMDVAKKGRERSRPLRSDWENVKDDIMRQAVMAKFAQNNEIRYKLTETGDSILIEHTKNDDYWGDGGDGSGKNMLGKILMETREKFK